MNPHEYEEMSARLYEVNFLISEFENSDDPHYGDSYYQRLLEEKEELEEKLDKEE